MEGNKAEQLRIVMRQKQNPTAWLTGSGCKADATYRPSSTFAHSTYHHWLNAPSSGLAR